MTDVLEKLCEVDVCFTNRLEETACKTGIDHGRFFRMYTQYVIRDISFTPIHTHMQVISTYWFLSGGYLHNWLIHVHAICSSTYMYMKNVNDVTGGYLKPLISRSILSGPLDFEIKRVACIKS